ICIDSGVTAWEACGSRVRPEIFHVSNPPLPPERDFFRRLTVDRQTGLLANEWCPGNVETRLYIDQNVIGDPSAIQWLNTYPAGLAWAQQRGVAVPLQAPPAQYCTADT